MNHSTNTHKAATLAQQSLSAGPRRSIYLKVFYTLFIIAMLLLLTSTGFAEQSYQSGFYTYTLTAEGDAIITDYSSDEETDLVVPDTLDGHPLVGVGEFSFDSCSFTSITLPEGLQFIGRYAFNWCNNMTTITLPDSLQSIESSAFAFCDALSGITLPDGLQSLGTCVFEECCFSSITIPKGLTSMGANPFFRSSIKTIEVSPDNKYFETIDDMLIDTSSMTLITYPSGKADTSCVVPDGILSIGKYAFDHNHHLESITLPEGLLSIRGAGLSSCDFTSIVLPDSLQSIGSYAFYQCPLTSVTLPENLQTLGNSAFASCKYLSNINIPSGLSNIEGNPFPNTSIETIQVSPDNETYEMIDQALVDTKQKTLIAYLDNGQVTTYTVPSGIQSIGSYAFTDCTSLTDIILPEGLETIEDYAFVFCRSLESIALPATLQFIDQHAFVYSNEMVLKVPVDSYSQIFAVENEIPFVYADLH